MANGSLWNPDTVRDVAESVGISSITTEAVDHLTRDVEFRVGLVVLEARKFMRHSKRTTLTTQDVSHALRVLDIEPLYGYESTRPLKFGEASIGPGQPLFYVEDEEVDFEKLINAPLPKVPREMTFTAHWLAIEGVQPTIPQNPPPADQAPHAQHLLPRGPNAQHLAALSGADNLSVKPQVKHVLSKELRLHFETVCAAVLDENNPEYCSAGLGSVRDDPGIHQLVPYFVHFVSEKVTHGMKSLFVLTQMLNLVAALLENPHLHLGPYVASLVPPVLTCLVGKRLGTAKGSSNQNIASNGRSLPLQYSLRSLAASVLQSLIRPSFSASTPTIKPRLARTLLRQLLASTSQPLGTYYGALKGLLNIGGVEVARVLILPNARALDSVLREALDSVDGLKNESNGVLDVEMDGGQLNQQEESEKKQKRLETEAIVRETVRAAILVEQQDLGHDGDSMEGVKSSNISQPERDMLNEAVGELNAEGIATVGRQSLVRAVLDACRDAH